MFVDIYEEYGTSQILRKTTEEVIESEHHSYALKKGISLNLEVVQV